MDWGLPGSSLHGILRARILKWIAFPFPWEITKPGIEPAFPVPSALTGDYFTTETPLSLASDYSSNYNFERVETGLPS